MKSTYNKATALKIINNIAKFNETFQVKNVFRTTDSLNKKQNYTVKKVTEKSIITECGKRFSVESVRQNISKYSLWAKVITKK